MTVMTGAVSESGLGVFLNRGYLRSSYIFVLLVVRVLAFHKVIMKTVYGVVKMV